jgi:hypothetical protein
MDSIYNILYVFVSKYYKDPKEKVYEILINLILVKEDVRPGYLIQYIDYQEIKKSKIFVDSLLKTINTLFPELIQSNKYEHNQGVIISKTDYNGCLDIGNKKMGEILGYPCFDDFDDLIGNKTSYYITDIYVYVEIYKIQLLANKCKKKKNSEFTSIKNKAELVLKNKKYNCIFTKEISVKIETIKFLTTQILIDKLIKGVKIYQSEKDAIFNILYNFGFDDILLDYFEEGYFQYHNPLHVGILIGLLINEKNERLEVFYPIQQHSNRVMKEVDEITKTWSKDLKKTLEKTSIII